jgi:hypothetical protein
MKKICREPGHVHSRSEKSECYWVYSALSHFSYSIFNIYSEISYPCSFQHLNAARECSYMYSGQYFFSFFISLIHVPSCFPQQG